MVDRLLEAVTAYATLIKARSRLARERTREASDVVEQCRAQLDAAERAYIQEVVRR